MADELKLKDLARGNTFENVIGHVKNAIKSYIQPKGSSEYVYMDIIGEEKLTFDSEVTDHYVESNVSYQDQISLKPMIYTVSGEVGELAYYNQDIPNTEIGYVAQKLSNLASFLPSTTRAFNQAKDKVIKTLNVVDSIDNIYTRLSYLSPSANKQQIAYLYLLTLWKDRTPVDVTCPWTTLQSYVITNVTFTQPKTTKDKSLISVSFKEFRETDLSYTTFNAKNYQGRAGYQKAPNIEQGQTTGLVSTLSYLKR